MIFTQFTDLSRVHFVGIGGAGMSGIAEILLEYDLEVSRLRPGAVGRHRAARGAAAPRSGRGTRPTTSKGSSCVVISSAVSENNPEVKEARRRGITVVRRAEMLGELMRLKYGIAIAGTHGKTTTTSLVGAVLTEAGLDPTVIVGGRLRLLGTGARLGHSDYLVAEADEFDRSFLRLTPVVAVITNIDRDHLDTYRDLEAIRDAFVEFASRVPFFGRVIVCLDDPNVQQILPRLADRRIVTYGFSPQADLSAVDLETHPDGSRFGGARPHGGSLGRVELPMPGRHNVANALAAIGVGLSLKIPFETIARALGRFEGVHRRFEHVGRFRGAAVVDDYAHHPTEVAATLEAARQTFPRRPGARGLPATPVLAHARPGRGVRPRAAGGRPRGGHRRLPVARDADPRGHRRDGGRGRPPQRPCRRPSTAQSWREAPALLDGEVREGRRGADPRRGGRLQIGPAAGRRGGRVSQGAHEEPTVTPAGTPVADGARVLEFRRSAEAPRRKRKSLASGAGRAARHRPDAHRAAARRRRLGAHLAAVRPAAGRASPATSGSRAPGSTRR